MRNALSPAYEKAPEPLSAEPGPYGFPERKRLLQLGEQIFADGVDGAAAVQLDVAGHALGGQILEIVGRGQGAVLVVVVDVVALVDGGLVLISTT